MFVCNLCENGDQRRPTGSRGPGKEWGRGLLYFTMILLIGFVITVYFKAAVACAFAENIKLSSLLAPVITPSYC